MPTTLSISSPGLLPIEGISLLGASTKRGAENKIGKFGSGLKYALAYFLRSDISIEIFIGTEPVTITTEPVAIGEQQFSRICINNSPTSISTTFGPDWSLWQAVREIYCNALDEGDAVFSPSRTEPTPDRTTFILSHPSLSEILSDPEPFFVLDSSRTLCKTPFGSVLRRASPQTSFIYKQGIRVYVCREPLAFDYDLPEINLNEERAPNPEWRMWEHLAELLASLPDRKLIEKFSSVAAKEWDSMPSYSAIPRNFSPAWQAFLSEFPVITAQHLNILPPSLINSSRLLSSRLYDHVTSEGLAKSTLAGGTTGYIEIPMQEQHLAALARILPLIPRSLDTKHYPIILGRFAVPEMRGLADNGKVVLSEKCFIQGDQYLLETIIEELVHLQFAVCDCTRAMQDQLLNLLCQELL